MQSCGLSILTSLGQGGKAQMLINLCPMENLRDTQLHKSFFQCNMIIDKSVLQLKTLLFYT